MFCFVLVRLDYCASMAEQPREREIHQMDQLRDEKQTKIVSKRLHRTHLSKQTSAMKNDISN